MAESIDDARAKLGWEVLLAYWFAQYAAWLALLTPVIITNAIRVRDIVGEEAKAEWLGLILGIGAAAAMISAPIWGALSDRTTARIGKRKPWIIAGATSLLVGLSVMGLAESPIAFGAGWLICQIGSNAAQASFNAVISDIVPKAQHGIVSALIGSSTTAAMVTGVFLTQFTTSSSLAMFLVPWIASPFAVALFVWLVPDTPARPESMPPLSLRGIVESIGLASLRHRDFFLAFLSRFLVMFGAAFSMGYQVYYLTDHLHVPPGEVAAFMVLSTSMMGALSFAISACGGWLSDKVGRRKPFVGGAAVVMAVGLFTISMATDFEGFLIGAAMTSIGQGLYYAVDIALCVEVLPDRESAARDMAVLQIASSLPQSLAPTVAPVLLAMAIGGLAGANYPLLFMTAALIVLCGAMAIVPIRKVR